MGNIANSATDSTSGELTQILQSRTEDSAEKAADTGAESKEAGQKEAEKTADVEITIYLYAGNRLLAEDGAEYLTYHFNNVGSTTAVTDKSGNIKYRYAYSVYGELLKGDYGEVLFLYNGQYGVQSDDNGLYYMRARCYNAAIKRFINQDTITGSIESSQSLNRYAYVEGNPVSYLDPFGLEKYDSEKIQRVMGYIQIAAQGTSIVFYLTGQKIIADVMSFIGEIASNISIALYMFDAYYSDNIEDQNKALNNASWGITCVITSKILSCIGKTSSLSPGALNEIEQPVMEISSKIVDAAYGLLSGVMGGQ